MPITFTEAQLRGALWGTVGVEIETLYRSRQNVRSDLAFFGPFDSDSGRPRKTGSPISMIFRDASVEGTFANLGNIGLYLGDMAVRNIVQLPTFVGGSEIITLPMVYEIADEVVASILSALEANGEVYNPRTSIHFHFGFPRHLAALKRILLMGLKVEGLLYRLAGMGNVYRGCINKSVYARPLASSTAVAAGDDRYAIIDPVQAMSASTEAEFWSAFMHNNSTPANRYHPARYYGINLYGLNLIGTVEFRMMNFTTNYGWVLAVMHLLQLIVDIAGLSKRKMIDELQATTLNMSREDVVKFLLSLNSLGASCESQLALTGADIEKLIEIIDGTPMPTLEYGAVRSHLRDYRYSTRSDNYPGRVFVAAGDTIESGNLTIHNISEHKTTILE